MKEIEILNIDREKLVPQILKNGGELIGEFNIEDVYLTNDKILSSSPQQLLRIRKENEKCFLTLKVRLESENFRIKKELETKVEEADILMKIFTTLGYTTLRIREKRRISYRLNKDVRIEFEKYSGELEKIPEFIEVEGKSEKAIIEGMLSIGISKSEIGNISTKELIKKYCN